MLPSRRFLSLSLSLSLCRALLLSCLALGAENTLLFSTFTFSSQRRRILLSLSLSLSLSCFHQQQKKQNTLPKYMKKENIKLARPTTTTTKKCFFFKKKTRSREEEKYLRFQISEEKNERKRKKKDLPHSTSFPPPLPARTRTTIVDGHPPPPALQQSLQQLLRVKPYCFGVSLSLSRCAVAFSCPRYNQAHVCHPLRTPLSRPPTPTPPILLASLRLLSATGVSKKIQLVLGDGVPWILARGRERGSEEGGGVSGKGKQTTIEGVCLCLCVVCDEMRTRATEQGGVWRRRGMGT